MLTAEALRARKQHVYSAEVPSDHIDVPGDPKLKGLLASLSGHMMIICQVSDT